MKFRVFDKGNYPSCGNDLFYLYRDNWDDYSYKTSFGAYYYDNKGILHDIGHIKIGYVGMEHGSIFKAMPIEEFDRLPDNYFSLGQSDRYYEHINQLGPELRNSILIALRDLAYDIELFEQLRDERVVKISLLRDLSPFMVQHQLHRIAHGGVRLTEYNFSFNLPQTEQSTSSLSAKLSFCVTPDSNPPSNIHVLIGRNGTGKTHLLRSMIRCIRFHDATFGNFEYSTSADSSDIPFANVLCVAFSPFDDFSCTVGDSEVPYTYIGLDKKTPDLIQSIEGQFWGSLQNCMRNSAKRERWMSTMEILKSDPAFERSNIDRFTREFDRNSSQSEEMSQDTEAGIKPIFSNLSSGHKVTLLIITSCVDKLEERSILFLDEPENHLHPPLLSAFVRALSYLLIDRNGVAIVSTHSPVILQEVPSNCVWALRRGSTGLIPERLEIETFGASISSLTSQVFGLEVTESGFHKLLSNAVEKVNDYDRILESFEGKLGDEAKGILRVLFAIKRAGGDSL